ncbi:MAG: bifunctional 4-hydroxy-3-methylbut-2-enyl diphosphate reductase/30S ribosomal protein S1 [Ruminococcaceae bacterium]|nr:bifunctional 4-hydroxy-3-methylbut-2-enyl diphosphate reductase/30S ribosomal protein S1 [Oscillospiraceae bacterium]
MPVYLAESAGFCFGVNNAVSRVYELLDAGEAVCTLGPIIHNPQVVEELERRGVCTVTDPIDTPANSVLVIRSHGVPRSVYDTIAARGIRYCDATCPFVAKIHRIVAEHSAAGAAVLIAGNPDHPEVLGIRGHAVGPAYIFRTPEELEDTLSSHPELAENPCIMVVQTTFNKNVWKKCEEKAKKLCTNLKIFDTICSATAKRQDEAVELAQKCDLVVIVGGRESSNTAKLRDVCAAYCPTLWVETADELPRDRFAPGMTVGLTAGASTPADIIKEVHTTMSEIINNSETLEKNYEEMSSEEFAAAVDATLQNPTDDKVRGLVVSIAPNEVQVEVIGRKQTGYIPAEELSNDPNANPADLVKVGDELLLLIMRTNDQEGTIMLSKRRVDALKGWQTVVDAEAEGAVLDGVVADVIKGGVLVVTNGVRVFVPASHASVGRMEDLSPLKGQEVQLKIIEINDRRRHAVGSIRLVAQAARKEQEAAFWAQAEVGQEYTGAVKSLTSYGAFVDLGGVDGMVHISEMSWSRIKHPSEVMNVGDTVTVFIKALDAEKRKISLGYRKSEDNPWEIFKAQYPIDSIVSAKIVGMTTFGAFAQILPGIDGLIHISQIANHRVEKPQDELTVGQEVQAKITAIDYDRKRISLSIRALLEPEAPAEEAAEAEVEDPAEETAEAEVEAPAEETAEAVEE